MPGMSLSLVVFQLNPWRKSTRDSAVEELLLPSKLRVGCCSSFGISPSMSSSSSDSCNSVLERVNFGAADIVGLMIL